MKKITYLIALLCLCAQTSLSQERFSRIKISQPTESTIHTIATNGIDLSCGSEHEGEDLVLELSQTEINSLIADNIQFTVEIDDMSAFYSERAAQDLPIAKAKLSVAKTAGTPTTGMTQKSSVSSVVMDNFIQYAECGEIDFVEPANFNLGDWAGCLTFSEVIDELDDMRTYSQNNGLDIVSVKANASSTGQTTWGNPANTITNNGLTYSGQGIASSFENQPDRDGKTFWDPETIYYIRITGNESTSAEGSKPQILFTSMIHSREVSALMNNIYFMWYLIENYDTNDAIKELVDNNELYFVPVVNPDGLKWNEHLDARADGQVDDGGYFQRKNLRPNTGGTSNTSDNRGVDLNRNFDYFWGINNVGSSGTQTSGTYRGPSPESEPETQIMVDFISSRNFKSAVWNHSFANSVPHPYGGVPSASTGREDEYYKWHEEMTRYNRYLYGATIFYESNGLPDDWMMGGNPDNNGSTGSGQGIIATTPEHGGQGFWPTPSTIVPIAKRSMRISLATAYYGGKYAKLHDLTQSNITNLISDLEFGIERIGQTASDFTVTVTPISSNISTGLSQVTETGMPVLSQRTVQITLALDPSITANEKIEYNVKLSNDDGVIYEANYEKLYQPTVLFDHNPDTDGLTGWTQSGGWNNTTNDSYSGTNALSTGTYSNNANKTITTTASYDFTNSEEVVIQYYTKWDIERNYDFVEVLASPDGGSSWISLCGNYTKPNATSATTSHDNKSSTYANFQANSLGQVYDGDRLDNWVMEEISIDDTYTSLLNSNDVKIRFNFRTDALNVNESYTTTNDGFFFDDFKIISVPAPCVTTVPANVTVLNITVDGAEITWDNIPSATYDIRYRETGSGAAGWTTITNHPSNSYTITGLSSNTDHDVRVRSRCGSTTSSYSTIQNFTTLDPCPETIGSFPYTEDFESTVNGGIGLWSQPTFDDGNWTRDSNGTPSGPTGPNGDFDPNDPTGQRATGFYMYVEATLNSDPGPSSTVFFESPCIDLTGFENGNFSFYYHMYGTDMGILTVDASTDEGITWTTINTLNGQQHLNQTDPWLQSNVSLAAYDNQIVKLRFTGTTPQNPPGNTDGTLAPFRSDMAIDYINITADVGGSAPPVAVCQDITVQLDGSGNATIVASQVDGGSTDDVAITNFSINQDTFTCNDIGTPVTVTLTVTDGDNQTDTCDATVTVIDQDIPVFQNVPEDIVFTCGINQPTWTDPTATDNCDTGLTVVRTDGTGLNSGDVFPEGSTTISYSVTDSSSNTATASFVVTIVVDNENPTAICQNITVQLDETGNATITPAQINNNSTDNCGIASVTASQTSFTCADEGANNVTLTVTDAEGNVDTCTAVVTITLQDEPTTSNCWETTSYNYTTCTWDINGTQPTEPTATNCWDDYQFNDTTCSWENQGTEPVEPTATNCWDDYQFNDTTCTWENQGTEPVEPTATNCWDDYQFNETTCSWENQGTQPAEPTATNCWDDYQFNNTTCAWENQGTEPVEPTAANCWDDYQFNETTCAWENQGTEPVEPTTECWETASFNDTTCSWEVSGTQPTEPTATNCWDDYQFNDTTCSWENQGTEPVEPTTECWETASFNETTCAWEVSGTQPAEPTAVNCWDDYQFNDTTCAWENQGTEPIEPTATNCWDDYQFNETTCAWENQGTEPVEPTGLECWETTSFNDTTCSWEVSGTQPAEPTAVNCWDDYQFNDTTCTWENQGTEPVEPTATNCWDDYQFNDTTCAWENQGSQPVEPTATNCWDDYQFNDTTCTWENQGTEPVEPTATNCWDDYQFNETTCTWENQGTQPVEPTATTCWDDYQFNDATCSWENQGEAPTAPTGLIANGITDISATIGWDALPSFDFDLRYRVLGSTTWIDILDITTNSQVLNGLNAYTQYEVEVRSKCSGTEVSVYSTTLTFVTLQTNTAGYCTSQSNDATEEYISRVQLADIDNTSGSQNYSDFTAISTVLRKGTAHTITVTPIWTGTVYNEAYSVWIDYNNDGDFEDAGEQVATQAPTNATPVTMSFTIPTTALDTKTRMRVSMKWNDIPDPCEAFQYGEVEDYSLMIIGSGDLIYTNSAWTPYAPSPTTVTENAFVLDGTYTVTSDIQINNMSVCEGAGIVVEKANAMTVNGILKTANNVVLESDSNEYSSLFVDEFVVGTAQYKRHVNATASIGGNDLISAPVYGEPFDDFRAQNPNILSNSANTLFLFGPFDKVTDTYQLYTNTETAPMKPGIGYRAASTDNGTFTFTGDVKIGDLSVPVVNDGPTNPEWNLVGNPFPAYLDLNEFLATNNAQFDLPRAGIYGYDGYASDGWTIWNQAYADANPNTLITPGQGFLIASATNNGQIEFTASMRRTGNADDFIVGRSANSSPIDHLQLKLESVQGGVYKTDFYFTDNASNGMDFNYDANIYGNQAPSNFALYSHLLEENSGDDIAVQSLGFDAYSNAIIPLGVHVSEAQQFTISISETTLPSNVNVYLVDTVNNSFTLLNNNDYTITLTENLNDIGRYFLRFEEETLSTSAHDLNDVSIYTTTQPEALFVKGQLFEDTKLGIYDIRGRLIKSLILNASETSHRIDVSSFNTGVYMVKLKNSSQEKTEKVVIK